MDNTIELNKVFLTEKKETIMSAISHGISVAIKKCNEAHPEQTASALKEMSREMMAEVIWNQFLRIAETPKEVRRDWFITRSEIMAYCVIATGSTGGHDGCFEAKEVEN